MAALDALLVLLLIAIALCGYAGTRRGARWWQRLLCGVAAVVIMGIELLFLPQLASIPESVGSIWFENHLQLGMSTADVDQLRLLTFGQNLGDANSTLLVRYIYSGNICYGTGREYELTFDVVTKRLKAWKSRTWVDGC